MLKSIDVLIGLAVIMLALSMAVTMITQFVTTVLNSRGRHLKRGVVDLLRQVDPALTGTLAARLADAVLRHPLISASGRNLGSVIHREELTTLLLILASPDSRLDQDLKQALTAALARNGVPDPDATLRNIRAAALELEAGNPVLAASVRQTMAILQEARTDYTAKVNNWFDQTIDRVAQRFTASTRAITFVGALLLAVLLQVDTISLVNRLSADDLLRQAFVSQAAAMHGASAPAQATGPTPPEGIEREYPVVPRGERRDRDSAQPPAVDRTMGRAQSRRRSRDEPAPEPGRAVLVQRAWPDAAASLGACRQR